MNYVLIPKVILVIAFFISAYSWADTPRSAVGQWQVADRTATIRIMDCDRKLWGVISRVNTPGTDKENPDPQKRSRSTLGLPILLAMHPGKEGWEGDIYNADNGKTYQGAIHLKTNEILHVEGCLIGNFLCGGEDWQRLEKPLESSDIPCPTDK